MKKKLSILAVSFIVAIAFMPVSAFAGTAPQMKGYDEVLKSGNTAYCAGAAGMYKVKLKKNKVKSAKRLYRSYRPFDNYSYVGSMHKKGKNIYFLLGTEGTVYYLYRVSTSGKAKKLVTLDENYYGYSIDGKKIYYDTFNWDKEASVFREMNLDGTGKKKTNVRPNLVNYRTNANGYKMIIKKKGKYLKDYLKTPKGTYYLGKVKSN